MITDLVALFKSLVQERTRQRDKVIELLERMSSELDALAGYWNDIATLSVKAPIPIHEIRALLARQRGSYEAVRGYLSSLTTRTDTASNIRTVLEQPVTRALNEKGVLYLQTSELIGLQRSRGESKDLLDATPEGGAVTNKIALLKRLRDDKSNDLPLDKVRVAALVSGIFDGAEELNGIAGKVRSAVHIIRSETPFI